MTTTPTGIPIQNCDTCGHRHPITRKHCPECGLAHLFPHSAALYGYDQRDDLYLVVNGKPVSEEVVAHYAESFPETIYFAGPRHLLSPESRGAA